MAFQGAGLAGKFQHPNGFTAVIRLWMDSKGQVGCCRANRAFQDCRVTNRDTGNSMPTPVMLMRVGDFHRNGIRKIRMANCARILSGAFKQFLYAQAYCLPEICGFGFQFVSARL